MQNLEAIQAKAKKWVFDVLAPYWAKNGVHSNGMFVEEIAHDGKVVDNYRRLMVQARQIYAFCELGSVGWGGDWKPLVEGALKHFITKGMKEDGTFIHSFASDGNVLDARLDLYNQAFGMFALAYAGKYLERDDLYGLALKTLATLEGKWSRKEGGFWEGEITPCPPYRQNPHMHIFEASLANYRFNGDEKWNVLKEKISTLFVSKFQQPCGAVTEYFDVDWKPLDGKQGEVVEPGHCFEWAWLFDIGFESGKGVKTADELSGFARSYGVCPQRGVAINEISVAGEIIDAKARLWPQTERLKAACARYNRTNDLSEVKEIADAWNGLEKYFATEIPGLWHDKMNPDGSFIIENVKASSFYHIICAFGELIRL
jgi:mannose-6-phosphate isomerase